MLTLRWEMCTYTYINMRTYIFLRLIVSVSLFQLLLTLSKIVNPIFHYHSCTFPDSGCIRDLMGKSILVVSIIDVNMIYCVYQCELLHSIFDYLTNFNIGGPFPDQVHFRTPTSYCTCRFSSHIPVQLLFHQSFV